MSLPDIHSPRLYQGIEFDVKMAGAAYDITLSNDDARDAALYFRLDVRERDGKFDVVADVDGLPNGTTAEIKNIRWKIIASIPDTGADVEFIVPFMPSTGPLELEQAIRDGLEREVDHYWLSIGSALAIKCKATGHEALAPLQ